MSALFKAIPKIQLTRNWMNTTVPLVRWKSKGSGKTELMDVSRAIAKPEEIEAQTKLDGTITAPVQVDASPINGVPSGYLKNRRARIYKQPKHAMQSGTANIRGWHIDFDTRERWENPLMGWSSTGDPLSNLQVEFNSMDDAISHCERNGWKWFLDPEPRQKKEQIKSYAMNFHWSARTRVSTK